MATALQYKGFVPYNWPDIEKGTTFRARKVTTSLDLTDVTISVHWKHKETGALKTTAVTVSAGEFTINSFLVDWTPGVYSYNLLFNFPDGTKEKYFIGTMKVKDA